MELGKSNVRKFLYCHEAEYIEGDDSCLKEFPIPPISPLKGSFNYVSSWAFEDIMGTYHELLRVRKRTLDLEFVCEGEDNLDALNAAFEDTVDKYGSRIFYMNYRQAGRGWVFSKVYLGTPQPAETPYIDMVDGSRSIDKIKFSIIEVDGTKMNI